MIRERPLDLKDGHWLSWKLNKEPNKKLDRRGQPPDPEAGPWLNKKLNKKLNEKLNKNLNKKLNKKLNGRKPTFRSRGWALV